MYNFPFFISYIEVSDERTMLLKKGVYSNESLSISNIYIVCNVFSSV